MASPMKSPTPPTVYYDKYYRPRQSKMVDLMGYRLGDGGCKAAITAAGLLLVLSTAISHDLMKKIINPAISDEQEIMPE